KKKKKKYGKKLVRKNQGGRVEKRKSRKKSGGDAVVGEKVEEKGAKRWAGRLRPKVQPGISQLGQ
ncbi:hypothetical protein KCA24_10890, partial [Escherichia coli]|nr:hypothetical protein [Escherichia coli]